MSHRMFLFDQLVAFNIALRREKPFAQTLRPRVPEQARNLDGMDVARAIDMIVNLHAQGESLAEISRSLNRHGLKGPYGARWYTASVRAYLCRLKRGSERT